MHVEIIVIIRPMVSPPAQTAPRHLSGPSSLWHNSATDSTLGRNRGLFDHGVACFAGTALRLLNRSRLPTLRSWLRTSRNSAKPGPMGSVGNDALFAVIFISGSSETG